MKVISAGLQNSVTTVYDQTKTYLAGRVSQKTLNGKSVFGPPLTNFIDVFTDTAAGGSVTPQMSFLTPNNRLFIVNTPAAGVMTCLLYTFDTTGVNAPAYIGRILLNVPNQAATTHTLRHLKVYDNGTTGWKITFSTTGSVAVNGGNFVAYNIALSDFVPVGFPTIGMAIASNAKAVYSLQDPAALGAANNITAMAGASIDLTNQILYSHNGTVAANQFIKWDLTASPTVAGTQTVTPPASAGTVFTTAGNHGFVVGDQVVLTSTGTLGTPWVVSTSTTMTVYFIQSTPAANQFTLSATSGGAVQTATANSTGTTTVMRGFGQSTSAWTSTKTGNITGLAGTLLLNNSEFYAVPSQTVDSNIPANINNLPCIFFATTSNMYLFKIADITNGTTTLPTLTTVNATGTGTDYTAISILNAAYSTDVGRAVFTSNTSAFYAKAWQSNVIKSAFGGLNTTYWENTGGTRQTTNFRAVTLSSVDTRMGWLIFVASTTGQRGLFYMDLESDSSLGISYLTSPVFDTSSAQAWNFIESIEELFDVTNSLVFSYKTAALQTDPTFASPTTGWTVIPFAKSLTTFALNNFTQLRIDFDIAQLAAQTPAQVNDLLIGITGKNEISDNWEGSVDNTTANSASPCRTAFRLIKAYSTSVPKLFFRSYDDSGNLVVIADTVTNAANFEYSTNNGTSWLPLGTIANVALTTELRYNWSSPPGVKVTSSLRES